MNELALFAGAGGGILGGHLLGWRTICAVERDAYAAQVLAQRQNDGMLRPFPIWSDVKTFDGTRWRGRVDVISGGFPCQDISAAGRGAGIEGKRSGLWSEFARIISEVRPHYVYVENSPMLTSRGLGQVLGDLASMGFDAEWGVVSAEDVGANHRRERIWIVAHSMCRRWAAGNLRDERCIGRTVEDGRPTEFTESSSSSASLARSNSARELQAQGIKCEFGRRISDGSKDVGYANSTQRKGNQCADRVGTKHADIDGTSWWIAEPELGRVANGVACRVDRLKAIGNGQVSAVAATAWRLLA